MTAKTFPTDILAQAERILAPVRGILEVMSAEEAQGWRNSLCRYLADGDKINADQTPIRIRAAATSRSEEAQKKNAAAEATKVEAIRAELLKHPHFIRVVYALAVEICALGTTAAMLSDLADDISRAGKKLR